MAMGFKTTASALALTAALINVPMTGAAYAQPTPAARPAPAPLPMTPPLQFDPATVPNPADVLAVMERLAAAEIAVMNRAVPTNDPGPEPHVINSNWVAATFYIGATRLARVSQNQATINFLRNIGNRYLYGLQGAGAPSALLNADDQAIGDLYLELYSLRPQPGMLIPLKGRLEYNLPYLAQTPAPKRLVWWWCDALFMAPPVLTRMSAITGDPKYIEAMDVQWWRTYDLLWDDQEDLFARDERFITRRSENGKKIYWGRGNGWVMAGLARVLEYMPADFHSRPRYEKLFKEMSARIIKLQQPDGMWRTSLLDTEAFPNPESSGTAFYTYALAFGINHGILDRATYQPHVLKAWAGLNKNMRPDGILGYVQRTGDQPVPTQPADAGLYASGGFLLAGYEMMSLGKPTTPLPVAQPTGGQAGRGGGAGGGFGGQPGAGPAAGGGGPAAGQPATDPLAPPVYTPNMTPEERERVRRAAETRAVSALRYDPLVDYPSYPDPITGKPPRR